MPKHPNGTSWFCASPQGNKGPFDEAKMLDLLQQGVIGGNTFIWRDGLPNWVALRESGDFDPPATPAAAPGAPAAPAQPAGIPAGRDQNEYLDSVFVGMVKKSWDRFNRRQRATEVDEVLLGAVITSSLDNGYSLIDLSSDGTNHYLRFEEVGSGNRVIFRLAHLSNTLLASEVLGHEAQVVFGYGERVQDFSRIWSALKQEAKGGYITQADPGIITVDGDISSQYVYVEVTLIWDLKEFLDPADHYKVNYPKLTEAIGAGIHALRKYLRGRFKP
jgi:hypothetical protein